MVELIIIIATLAIVIMAWSKISKALDWTGARIGETGDMLSDLTVSGAKQTSRGVVISHGSLEDTIASEIKKKVTRSKDMTKFKAKLSEDEKKVVKETEDYFATLLAR